MAPSSTDILTQQSTSDSKDAVGVDKATGARVFHVDKLKTTVGMVDSLSKPNGVYGCTPKYFSNHANPDRMARFYIPSALYRAIIDAFPEAAQDSVILKKLSSADPVKGGYHDFLLQSVQENWSENVQVTETLSDNYVAFAMGQKAPIFSYSGVLINSQEDDWRTKFFLLYSQYLRASKMARFGRTREYDVENVSLLKYDNIYVRGVMLNFSMSMNAQNELAVPFSFSYLVKEIHPFRQTAKAGIDFSIVDAGNNYKTAGYNIAATDTTGRAKTDPYRGMTGSRTLLASRVAQSEVKTASTAPTKSNDVNEAGATFSETPGQPVTVARNEPDMFAHSSPSTRGGR